MLEHEDPTLKPNQSFDGLDLEAHYPPEMREEHNELGVREEINRRLDLWASKHAAKSNGRLIAYEPGDRNYPDDIHGYAAGKPLDHAMVDLFAGKAEKSYPLLRGTVRNLEEGYKFVSRLAERSKKGDSFAFVFGHDDLIDMALGLGAFYSELDSLRMTKDIETAAIINTMIERLGVRIDGDYSPAVDALGIGADHTIMTIPKTQSARKHMGGESSPEEDSNPDDSSDGDSLHKRREIEIKGYTNVHNGIARAMVGHLLRSRRKSVWLSLCPGGSEVFSPESEPNRKILRRTNKPTARMLMNGSTYVIPVATSYTHDWEPFFIVPAPPQKLEKPDDLHGIMELIAKTMDENTPNTVSYEYEQAA